MSSSPAVLLLFKALTRFSRSSISNGDVSVDSIFSLCGTWSLFSLPLSSSFTVSSLDGSSVKHLS